MARSKTKKSPGGIGSFVLMVGDEGAILVQMQKKRVVKRIFAQSPEAGHTRALQDALNSAPRAPITMLVDMMDQSYVRQTLPPVSSLSVGKIVRRRLEKDFARDDIKGYLLLDREKTGRRDWNYLMVSLANPGLLQKWIAFAVERPNPFRGIGLVPLESQDFINAVARTFLAGKEDKPREWQMLVSHHKVGGFRQVVLKDGKLIFTRMAQPIGESNPEVIAGNIEQEIINTQEYLKRMGLQDSASLGVTILVSNDIKLLLDRKNIKAGEYHFMTPHEMAQALALTDAAQTEDHFGDVVISAFAGRRRKLMLPLNTPYITKLRRFASYITYVRGAALLALLGLLAWGGMIALDIWDMHSDVQGLEDQQKQLKSGLATIKLQAKSMPKQMNSYIDAMALHKALAKRRYDALAFVGSLSGALADSALIKAMEWTVANPLAVTIKDGEKRQLQVDLEVQLTTPLQSHDAYIASAQKLFADMKRAFPNFELVHSELPGLLSDAKEYKTVLDDAPAQTAAGNDLAKETLKVTLKGPLKADANAR